MNGTTILVPVRYPLQNPSVRTLRKAVEIAEETGDATLYILHINLLQGNESVTKNELLDAVEREFGALPNATYEVDDSFFLEEAILDEIVQQKAEYVVIGQDRRARWRRILSRLLRRDIDLESFLQKYSNGTLVVV